MKTWKKCAVVGILAIIVFAFIGCPPEKTVETGIKLEGVWQDPDVDQANLNDIKATFEKYYYPDTIKFIIVTETETGRVGTSNTVKIAKAYITAWEIGDASNKSKIDLVLSNHLPGA